MNNPKANVNALERGGHTMLGIHLDMQSLRVVEVHHGAVKASRSIPYPADAQPGKPGFAMFIKGAVSDIEEVRRLPVWVSTGLPSLQVRFLSLPKVRPRQLSNLVYWTYRKEIPFDAATTMFDFDSEGDVSAPGAARKTDVTAYTVAREDVDKLTALFNEAGLHVEGLIIPSFAMRNVFRTMTAAANETVIGLHVGEDSSSIMFVRGRQIVAHRVFKTGMNAMLDVLRDRYPNWSPAEAFNQIAKAMESNAASSATFQSSPPADDKARFQETVIAAFGRLVQQVERSMSAYLVGRGEEEIKQIFVAGSLNGFPRLMSELGNRLGLIALPLNGFDGAAKIPRTGPAVAPIEGGKLAIALGAALSDSAHAPNLLHTYVKREHEERAARARKIIRAIGVTGIVLMIAFHAVLNRFNHGLRDDLAFQRNSIEKFAPYPDRAMILTLMGRAAIQSAQLKGMAERCLPVAVFNQIATNTPEDIRLTSVQLYHQDQAEGSGRRNPKVQPAIARDDVLQLKLEGVVFGDTALQESRLASFMLRMEDTEMFSRVALTQSTQGREGAEPVLTFALAMDVEPLSPPMIAAAPVSAQQGARP